MWVTHEVCRKESNEAFSLLSAVMHYKCPLCRSGDDRSERTGCFSHMPYILSTVQKQSKHKDDNEYFTTMSMEPLSTGCNTHFINLGDGEGAAISNDFTGLGSYCL